MENNHDTDDDHFDKFLSAYPDYVRKNYPLLVPPGMMERVNAALERARPSKEEWAKRIDLLKKANLAGAH
jgi:hypothetical protein